jgi:azurin
MLRIVILSLAAATVSAAPLQINIGTLPGLQYDKPRFAVEPGQKVVLTFKNTDEMEHNLAIVAPGKRLDIVLASASLTPDSQYIPRNDDVLWHTPVLKPDETAELKFTAPKAKGIYPYVCTFPGHGLVMYGAMYVGIKMPNLAQDKNISPMARASGSNKILHAWPHRRPLMYRIFMPDASPAAIAVALPHGVSYCWDAGQCRLRYAWIGGFIDPIPVWKGNGNGLAKIIGNKFWIATKPFPIHLGNTNAIPKIKFLGYRKVENHPEFHYSIDGADVYERITALPSGMGLVRHFRIEENSRPVSVMLGTGKSEISKGQLKQGVSTLTATEAKDFTITHRHAHGK